MSSIEQLLARAQELDAKIASKDEELRKAINENEDPRIIDTSLLWKAFERIKMRSTQSWCRSGTPYKFLDGKDWWLDGEKNPMRLLAGTKLPRQGRRGELHRIWQRIDALFETPKARRALYYLHASAGVGKTYILRELLKRKPQDIPEHLRQLADEVKFAVVNFNSDTMPPDNATQPPIWFQPLFSLTLRLIFSNCVKRDVTWDTFLGAVFRADIDTTSLDLHHVVGLLHRRSGKNKLVLLVDEIRIANDIKPGYAEDLRKLLCRAQDSQDPALDVMVLFSTLNEELMTREGGVRRKTGAERSVIAATGLPLFTPEQTKQLLASELPDCYCTNRETQMPKDVVMRFLVALTGGHGRCIEFVIRTVKTHQSGRFHPTKLQELVDGAIELCGSVYAKLELPVLKLALLGKRVRKDMRLPGMNCTATELVTEGQLIDSFPSAADKWMTPSVPKMFVLRWLKANEEDPVVADLHSDLSELLDLRWKFIAEDWESFHPRWEALIRHCRADYPSERKELSLFELYRRPKHSGKTPAKVLHTKVDASVVVRICGDAIDWSTATAEQLHHVCWLPPDPQNAGFDALLFYPIHPSQQNTTLVFIENRFSIEGATTVLSLKEVKKKHEHCVAFVKAHFESKPFVLLFVCLREAWENTISKAPPNCMFLLHEELARLYGPTLMRFVESLDGYLRRTKVLGSRTPPGAVHLVASSSSTSAASAHAALGSSRDKPASEQKHSCEAATDIRSTMPKRGRHSNAAPSSATTEDEPGFVIATADGVGPDTLTSTAERDPDAPAIAPKSWLKRAQVQVQVSTGVDTEAAAKAGARAKRQKSQR